MNTVHLCNNMEFMAKIPNNYYELAIVDPPYGIDIAKSGKVGGSNCGKVKNYGAKNWDNKSPDKEYFDELIRISKNQIIWGANHFISKIPYDGSCWIVWNKDNTGNFADCELAWTSFDTAVRIFKWRWNGMLQQNMALKEDRIHPTQKPIGLYKFLLHNYAKQGDKIFDSHVGSGSSRIACYDLGYDFEGCEIDKDYWQLQEDRYNKHIAQLSLFTPQELEPMKEYEQDSLF